MRNIYACLLSVVWFMVPVLASANTWPGFGVRGIDRDTVAQGWLKQGVWIRTVADPQMDRRDQFDMDERNRSVREAKESRAITQPARERSHEPARSNNTPLSLSNDHDHLFDSVHRPSHRPSHRPDPWWGRRVEGDPMIRGLNRSPSGK